MNKKQFQEQVMLVRQAIIDAIPTDVSFPAIIIALAQVIVIFQERAIEIDE